MESIQLMDKFMEGFVEFTKQAGVTDPAQVKHLLIQAHRLKIAQSNPTEFQEGYDGVMKDAQFSPRIITALAAGRAARAAGVAGEQGANVARQAFMRASHGAPAAAAGAPAAAAGAADATAAVPLWRRALGLGAKGAPAAADGGLSLRKGLGMIGKGGILGGTALGTLGLGIGGAQVLQDVVMRNPMMAQTRYGLNYAREVDRAEREYKQQRREMDLENRTPEKRRKDEYDELRGRLINDKAIEDLDQSLHPNRGGLNSFYGGMTPYQAGVNSVPYQPSGYYGAMGTH